jgi:hypothetical protein
MVEVKAQLRQNILTIFTTRKMVPALDLRFRNIIEAHGGYLSHQTDWIYQEVAFHHLFYSWNS